MSEKRGAGDLRVRRTRKLLREALVSLVEEKGYEAVTVREITERAMINRATFYAHYDEKYDLLLDVVGEAFGPVRDNPPLADEPGGLSPQEPPGWLVRFLEDLAAHAGFYRGVLGDGGSARMKDDLRTYYEGLLWSRLRAGGVVAEKARVPPEVVVGFASAAALGSLSWWLEKGTPYPAERVAAWYLEMISSGVFRALGLPAP